MDNAQILKSTQEQAIAAWIDRLNQLRLNILLERLASQDENLENALAELQTMKIEITDLKVKNRGSTKGMHGFIAEIAEVYIGNAQKLIKGLDKAYVWLDDNGPVDLTKNGTNIQQKFVKSGGLFGLDAIKKHKEKYPDFIKNGGKYQIPKDFYEQFKQLISMSREEAAKDSGNTYRLWKRVQDFFEETGIDPNDIEPSLLDYSSVQVGKIDDTIKGEESNIKAEDQQIRNEAYDASKPTLKQGTQAAAFSAAAEGGMNFCLGIAKKRKQGRRLMEFTAEDWQDVGIDTAKGSAQGGIRGGVIYTMTNFTSTPAAVANALVTASFGVVAQAYQLRQGNITEEDFIINSEIICLDVSVSAVAALLGQILIPVPVLGAVIGNMVGMFMYQIAKDHLSDKEMAMITNYRESYAAINIKLEARYQKLIAKLRQEISKYTSMMELAFDVNVNVAFAGSIAFADYVGAAQNKVLRSKSDIDTYFLN